LSPAPGEKVGKNVRIDVGQNISSCLSPTKGNSPRMYRSHIDMGPGTDLRGGLFRTRTSLSRPHHAVFFPGTRCSSCFQGASNCSYGDIRPLIHRLRGLDRERETYGNSDRGFLHLHTEVFTTDSLLKAKVASLKSLIKQFFCDKTQNHRLLDLLYDKMIASLKKFRKIY
jgi:hypothetical protein